MAKLTLEFHERQTMKALKSLHSMERSNILSIQRNGRLFSGLSGRRDWSYQPKACKRSQAAREARREADEEQARIDAIREDMRNMAIEYQASKNLA